ncbi:MAG: helix-turn-helix domain-containing protein [Furfurilactobacillus sp.]|uniref:Helix-turn-helix domain-containing protein n=1 Tax=Furfurilactobacillus milii TaxID=2888272 RepID=A0ABT6DDL1_9LACO|nr:MULTISPECIES: helix-turn-helix transcriptional regulator [Furfurilactobacillus]QLE66967.1 DNA-binding helix-turn-helix protein [Furfurilactobacillus rossiae]MCF6161977.1 helix-turn-helix domain-containing protein [Furfurilactobacillus milii]MCF6164357.1 helix-turn-helix domain-containing protein [Furfurilactobacillus milii]MCF6419783.1 helix-turn-helix domain-containing protein [Furfurilactobacillus milii]MCH4010556.1 helix-turn-helix domain-containing protein [Furfurilactobacillus sp.]
MTTLERIKEISKKRGWSLQKTAEEAGIGVNSIYKWNKQTPSITSLTKVADALNVSVDYLLGKSTALQTKPDTKKSVDIADDDVIMTYEGRPIPPEDLEYIKRILNGGK